MNCKFIDRCLVFIGALLLAVSCNQPTTGSDAAVPVCDSFITYTSDYHKDSFYLRIKDSIERKSGLGSISNGFDSLQIRVWLPGTSRSNERMVSLKNAGGVWSGTLYDLIYEYDKAGKYIIAVEKTSKVVTPKSGWKNFMDTLYALKIMELPSMDELPGYELMRDGEGMSVEVATRCFYRVYNYQLPEHWAQEFWQAKNAARIADIVNRQMGL